MRGNNKQVTLKIRTLKGYHDADEVFLHAVFQILTDFVEKEKPYKPIPLKPGETESMKGERKHIQEQIRCYDEMQSLYRWWKIERPKRINTTIDKRIKLPPHETENIPGSRFSRIIQPDRKIYAAYYRALKKNCKLRIKWDKEDKTNLHRLVDIKDFLWT